MFYPIGFFFPLRTLANPRKKNLGTGAMQTDFDVAGVCPVARSRHAQSRCVVLFGRAANPPTGFGRRVCDVRSTCAAVGSLWLVTVRADSMTRIGYSSKSGDVNSSTMKGL